MICLWSSRNHPRIILKTILCLTLSKSQNRGISRPHTKNRFGCFTLFLTLSVTKSYQSMCRSLWRNRVSNLICQIHGVLLLCTDFLHLALETAPQSREQDSIRFMLKPASSLFWKWTIATGYTAISATLLNNRPIIFSLAQSGVLLMSFDIKLLLEILNVVISALQVPHQFFRIAAENSEIQLVPILHLDVRSNVDVIVLGHLHFDYTNKWYIDK